MKIKGYVVESQTKIKIQNVRVYLVKGDDTLDKPIWTTNSNGSIRIFRPLYSNYIGYFSLSYFWGLKPPKAKLIFVKKGYISKIFEIDNSKNGLDTLVIELDSSKG